MTGSTVSNNTAGRNGGGVYRTGAPLEGGQGIRNARVTITGNSLREPIVTTTGSFGYYSFENLEAGQTYIITVNSKRFTFQAPSRVITLTDNVTDADFVADTP